MVEWVTHKTGDRICPPYAAVGVEKDGNLVGGWVFNNYNGSNVECSWASSVHLTRGHIRAICHYCFVQSKVNRVTAITRRSNRRVRVILPRLGFEFERVAKKWFGPNRSDDGFVFVMFKTNAERWLNGRAYNDSAGSEAA